MGADSTYGRRRPCSRECCLPPTRAQNREHARREIADGCDDNDRSLIEDTLNSGRTVPMTDAEVDEAVRYTQRR